MDIFKHLVGKSFFELYGLQEIKVLISLQLVLTEEILNLDGCGFVNIIQEPLDLRLFTLEDLFAFGSSGASVKMVEVI